MPLNVNKDEIRIATMATYIFMINLVLGSPELG